MKKHLVLYFVISLLVNVSCTKEKTEMNDDDDSVAVRKISETIQRTYDQDTGDLEAIYKNQFKNNQIVKAEYFNANEELLGYQNFEYNDDSLLSRLVSYNTDDLITYDSTLQYDEMGRLISEETSENNGNYITTVDIQYNTNNTITRTEDSNGDIEDKLYFLNENNIIYKVERNGSVLDEAIYDADNNVLSMNDRVTYSYYDKTIKKKGVFKTSFFGLNGNNTVLWGEYLLDQVGVYGINYVKEIVYSSNTNTFEHEFDEEDYPLKWSMYSSGKLQSETEITYE